MKRRGCRRRPSLFLKDRSPRARRRLLAIFLIVFGVGAARARAACVELTEQPPRVAGLDGATAFEFGDLDRDGDPDAVVTLGGSGTVVWLQNQGDPQQWTLVTIGSVGTQAQAIALADLDRDGDLDVAVAALTGNTAYWFENDGTPTGAGWTARTITSTIFTPAVMGAADVDRDGHVDLVVGTDGDSGVNWLRNDGTPLDGGLWTVHGAGLNDDAFHVPSLAVADFDRDGDLDVAAVEETAGSLVALVNSGTPAAGYWVEQTIAIVGGLESVVAADLDRDGDADLVTIENEDQTIFWHENDGTPFDGAWTTHVVSTKISGPTAVRPVDVDGDGDLDLAVIAGGDLAKVSWLENRDGVGATWLRHSVDTVSLAPTALLALDIDRIAPPELVVLSAEGAQLTSYQNDRLLADELFGAPRTISTSPVALRSLEVVDLDGDGDPDPLVANLVGDAIDWFANDGSAEAWALDGITGTAEGSRVAVAGDLDRDGDLDVVGGAEGNGDLTWYRNDGLEAFSPFAIDLALGTPSEIALADFDRNGTLDVVLGDASAAALFWYANDGSPSSGAWTRLTIATGIDALVQLRSADVDRDGDADLVVASPVDDALLWLDNGGNGGSWTKRTLVASVGGPFATAVADLDGDGDLDALFATGSGLVAWLESDSTPTSGAWTLHTVATGFLLLEQMALLDFDGDGDLDLALPSSTPGGITLYDNFGVGLFDFRTVVALDDAFQIAPADLDRDGDVDLTVGTGADLVWLPNLGTRVHDDGFDAGAAPNCWSSVAAGGE